MKTDGVLWRPMMNEYIYIYISKIQFLHCVLQTTWQFIMTTSFDSAACDAESAELSQQRNCCAGETVMTAILNY